MEMRSWCKALETVAQSDKLREGRKTEQQDFECKHKNRAKDHHLHRGCDYRKNKKKGRLRDKEWDLNLLTILKVYMMSWVTQEKKGKEGRSEEMKGASWTQCNLTVSVSQSAAHQQFSCCLTISQSNTSLSPNAQLHFWSTSKLINKQLCSTEILLNFLFTLPSFPKQLTMEEIVFFIYQLIGRIVMISLNMLFLSVQLSKTLWCLGEMWS